jgi:hypothetical protein
MIVVDDDRMSVFFYQDHENLGLRVRWSAWPTRYGMRTILPWVWPVARDRSAAAASASG